jgi:hypothetical protein
MGKRKNLVDEIIAKNAKNEMEAAAITDYAVKQEVGMPTPTKDLPNLKKDRIVLELINRTNTDGVIDLFALPAGVNESQGIEYGDLFETVYSAVSIPIAELSINQTYSISWTDGDGASQSATTSALTDINNLITELNTLTSDSWGYYIDGTNYVLHKEPIDTWVYWTPPVLGGGTVTSNPPNTLLNATTGIGLRGKSLLNAKTGANKPLCRIRTNVFTWWTEAQATTVGFGGFGTDISLAGLIDATFNNVLEYDSINDRVLVYSAGLTPLSGWVLMDTSGAIPVVHSSGSFAVGQWCQSITYDKYNNCYWGAGGSNGAVAANDMYLFDSAMNLTDTWTAASASGLGVNIASIFWGLPRFVPISATELWVSSGWRLGGNGAIVRIGGYGAGNIIKSVVTSYAQTSASSFGDAMQQIVLGESNNILYGSTAYNNAFNDGCLFKIDLSTGAQIWEVGGLNMENPMSWSNNVNALIANTEYSGNDTWWIRAYGSDLQLASPIVDGDLVPNGYNLYFAGSYWDEENMISYKNGSAGLDFRTLNPYVANPTSSPAGTKEKSFYTEQTFTSIIADNTPNEYFFSNFFVIGGTGISVTETTGNITYAELVQALRTNIEPYFFKDMSVYADNIEQANIPIKKVMRGVSGTSKTMFNNPTILTENQYVITEEISIAPKTLNQVDYKVKSFESVRIIINYTKGNLNAIAETLDAYMLDGIPFNVAINQLSEAVSVKEKDYLEDTLKSVWERKKIELAKDGVEIEIENLFEPQEVIDEKKKKLIGDKMTLIKSHIESERLKQLDLEGVSPSNIKKIVANYAVKGVADKIYNPYSYMDSDED